MNPVPAFPSVADAMAAVQAGLRFVAAADATQMSAQAQAECLQMMERANAIVTAARASVLSAFTSGQGYGADADYSPRAWLIHKTRVTNVVAVAHTAWAKRTVTHPQVMAALGAEDLSESYGRAICQWTDKLPEDCRPAADAILLSAATAGMDLRDLAGLAAEMYERSRPDLPDEDPARTFEDRAVHLETTFQGAGVLNGDLTPECAAVVGAVLDALGAPAGAENSRTHAQRYHDALQEAMRSLCFCVMLDWNAFEKACVRHGVRLSAYTGGDLDLSTAEGAYYGGMETLRARRESAVKSARVREAQDREARKGRRTGGGQRWFGYTRIYANPDEPNHKKRHILREEINPVEAEAIRDAATRVLEHGESVASIARDWAARAIRPVAAAQWWPTSIVGTLTSPRLAGLREWQGRKYPAAGWPAIIDVDTHERLVRLFGDPARRRHVVRAPAHLLSGIATCPKCGRGLHYRRHAKKRADSYGCVKGPAGCGGTAIKADLLEEYVTGAVLDALESPRVQQALRAGEDQHAPRRAGLLEQIQDAQERREEARRDYAGRVIDRADWLDIRQRTEDEISAARREYDRLAGPATVLGDIPPSERVRDAWESWSTDRRRAAIRAVLHRVLIKPLPPGAPLSSDTPT